MQIPLYICSHLFLFLSFFSFPFSTDYSTMHLSPFHSSVFRGTKSLYCLLHETIVQRAHFPAASAARKRCPFPVIGHRGIWRDLGIVMIDWVHYSNDCIICSGCLGVLERQWFSSKQSNDRVHIGIKLGLVAGGSNEDPNLSIAWSWILLLLLLLLQRQWIYQHLGRKQEKFGNGKQWIHVGTHFTIHVKRLGPQICSNWCNGNHVWFDKRLLLTATTCPVKVAWEAWREDIRPAKEEGLHLAVDQVAKGNSFSVLAFLLSPYTANSREGLPHTCYPGDTKLCFVHWGKGRSWVELYGTSSLLLQRSLTGRYCK